MNIFISTYLICNFQKSFQPFALSIIVRFPIPLQHWQALFRLWFFSLWTAINREFQRICLLILLCLLGQISWYFGFWFHLVTFWHVFFIYQSLWIISIEPDYIRILFSEFLLNLWDLTISLFIHFILTQGWDFNRALWMRDRFQIVLQLAYSLFILRFGLPTLTLSLDQRSIEQILIV